jgi:hypothetical protein
MSGHRGQQEKSSSRSHRVHSPKRAFKKQVSEYLYRHLRLFENWRIAINLLAIKIRRLKLEDEFHNGTQKTEDQQPASPFGL